MSSETQIIKKEPKETTKERGLSLAIMGQSTANETYPKFVFFTLKKN